MSVSASSPAAAAGDEKQEAAPVRRCKGVNDLDKVVLREVRGSSAEVRIVPACRSRSRAVAARSCSACRIPAQIRGACHGAGFIGCLPLPVAYSSRQQFGASGLVAVALRPSADFPR